VTADFDLELQADQDASVLVSHVMGRVHDQALVVKPTPDDRITEAIYGQQSGSSDIVCVRLHQCDTYLSTSISCLVTQASGPGPAPDIARKNGKRHFIALHMHGASGDQSGPLCNRAVSVVEDALASRSPEHFLSIKWMPVLVLEQARAVLEVFS
jgi:hypothetical protein